MKTNSTKLREDWLRKVAKRMEKRVADAAGAKLPPYRVSCGFPSRMALPTKKGVARGQCWAAVASSDGHAEIFLSPLYDDAETIAAILAHELIHACLPLAGHKRPFQKAAAKIGHIAPFTTATPTDDFWAWVRPILAEVGPYPHAHIKATEPVGAPKKQTNRMVKVTCDECGYTARVARKWLALGAPHCPEHGPMQCEAIGGDDGEEMPEAA